MPRSWQGFAAWPAFEGETGSADVLDETGSCLHTDEDRLSSCAVIRRPVHSLWLRSKGREAHAQPPRHCSQAVSLGRFVAGALPRWVILGGEAGAALEHATDQSWSLECG